MIRWAGRTGIFDPYDRVASCMKVYRFIGVVSKREGEIDSPVCLRRSWLIFIDVNGKRGGAISRDSRNTRELRENNKDVFDPNSFVFLDVPSWDHRRDIILTVSARQFVIEVSFRYRSFLRRKNFFLKLSKRRIRKIFGRLRLNWSRIEFQYRFFLSHL